MSADERARPVPGAGSQSKQASKSVRAEAAFRARLAELGATVLEPQWLGSGKPHRVRCAAGHECAPYPTHVRKGIGICRACAGNDPATAEAAFRARVQQLGGTVMEPEWLGSGKPHRVRCAVGHEGAPYPTHVARGIGICRVCAGRDSATAWATFRARVEQLGGTVLAPVWLGAKKPHRARCVAGHDCTPRPDVVRQGNGICRVCAGQDAATAEAAFRAGVAALGGTVLGVYVGNKTPVRARCAAGHECRPHPGHIQQGGGICRVCAGHDPAAAEAEFHARVEALGGRVLEPAWLGAQELHRVRCAAGHEVTTRPNNVRSGQGICRHCAGKTWDVFYVVVNRTAGRIKFGISSGSGRPRLSKHRGHGYTEVLRLHVDLPDELAPAIERACIRDLARSRVRPVKGREYYRLDDALPIVLAVLDRHAVTT